MIARKVALCFLVGVLGAGVAAPQVVGEVGLGSGGLGSVGIMGGISLSGASMPGVKGAPFSLVETTTILRTLGDGTTINRVQEERRMRDSEGRERTESGTMKDGKFEVNFVHLMDPVGRTMTTLFPQNKRAIVMHMAQAQVPTPEQEAKAAEFRAKAAEYRKEHPKAAREEEDLPTRTIAGLYAEGKRRTLVIPIGKMGNDREIRVVTETWTSPELKIVLERTSDDPQTGKTTKVVSEVQRMEPEGALFQVPGNYRTTDRK